MFPYHHDSLHCACHLLVLSAILLLGLTTHSCTEPYDIDLQRAETENDLTLNSTSNIGIAFNDFEANILQASVEPFTRGTESENTIEDVCLFPKEFISSDEGFSCDVVWGLSCTTRVADYGYNLQWSNIGNATQIAIQPRNYAATSFSTYTVSPSGNVSAITPYYFETANSDVITSWYPYNSGNLSSFEVQTNQSILANYIASDLLYTSAAVSATSQSLSYTHKMAQIIVLVTVSNANKLPNPEVQSLSISGLKTNCTTNFASLSGNTVRNPTFTTGSTTATIKAYRKETTSNSTTYTAEFIMCVPAQTISTSQVLTVKVGGITFTGKLTNAQTLQQGYAYNISVSINGSLTAPLIDMGTGDGLLWSTVNLGASLPADYGDYYEWGATSTYPASPNSSRTWSTTYPWAWLDYTGVLPSSNDIVKIRLGGRYRIPTLEEFNRLIANCNKTNTYKTNSGGQSIQGNTLTSKTNGNQIFIPMGGFYDTGNSSKSYVGTNSCLWSATSLIYNSSYKDAWDYNNGTMYSNYVRAKGMPLRPVYDTTPPSQVVDMGTGDGLLWAVANVGAALPADYGNYYEWGATAPYPASPNSSTIWSASNPWAWLDYTGTMPLSNDIAQITYGEKYRTPTKADFDRLIANCNWNGNTYMTNSNGESIKGYTATSKTNGNQIFIPMGGMYNTGESSKISVGAISYLWSATSLIYNNSYKDAWDFNNGNMYDNYVRAKGMPIRPVYDNNM